MNKLLLSLAFISFSGVASDSLIHEHPDYKASIDLVERLGKSQVIKQVVTMQREQLERYGSNIDRHFSVLRTVGSDFAMKQTVELQFDKWINELNEQLKGLGKKQLTRADAIKFFEPSGIVYSQQIKLLCLNPSTRGLVDSGIEYIYTYYDQDMVYIDEIVINKKVCSSFIAVLSMTSYAEGLTKVSALNGKVSVLAPNNFGPMPTRILEMKYPSSRRPTEVLSDKTGGVSVAFNHTYDAMQPYQITEAHVAFSKTFHNRYPSAKWIRDEVIKQNGSVFMVMELITPALDTKIHNIIYGTSVDGRFLLVAFNTTVEQSAEWLPIGKTMMSSLRIE